MTTIVALHVSAAVAAVLLGIGIWTLRRGTPRHRWLGRVWALAMVATAVSSFGIRELRHGELSWLHLLSAWVLISLTMAIAAVRRGNVALHRRGMLGLYAGLVIAGVAALAVPGRTLSLSRAGAPRMLAAAEGPATILPAADGGARQATMLTRQYKGARGAGGQGEQQ
ncbi:DUF2306 domain-containing protein [Pandoraea nosoerga]|uniref:DUF2306 domain-containing protein n=1 Tax=Pandoraea nosoerga TaxID=2508296 RepID=A0A5E4VEA5_9BURK|nr:DUF2306 domain-containing protein [Pandoraea nosoerga]MBN4681244.1 DUF2306 domain-containing protein [Pandoraea nosoerga]VVE10113.1 hypothetical protein PNO31109_02582 [Pandoraea nosoerga]